jgi:hypothetical protein
MRALTGLSLLLLLAACDHAAEGAKEALNKGGELAGKAAGEVLEGVKTGVEESWSVDVRLSPELQQRGLGLGKTAVESDSLGKDNLLVVYLTSASAMADTLQILAFDKDSLEMGRALLPINAAAGSGAFHEVHFPARTDLERKCTVYIR